ncbi:MAG: HmuY family protein [Chitinophagaceae bacterium]
MKSLTCFIPKRCRVWLLAIPLLWLASCSKDATTSDSLEDGKSTVIYDLAGDTEASVSDSVDGKTKRDFYTFLFRFSDKKQLWIYDADDSTQYLQTTDWDLAFAEQYNSIVYVNNGSYTATPGYGGPGTSQMVIVNQPYEQVTEAPSDEEFEENAVHAVGWDNGTGVGWYTYSLSTHLAVPIANRTFVIKTVSGKYAKLQLVNIYKGNPPAVTDLNWPAPYLTFRYFVQEDGSRDLNTN